MHTKFQPNRTIFVKVIHPNRFSASRLVCVIRFQKNFSEKSEWMQCEYKQKIKLISQGNQKLSHFLGFFFWKISSNALLVGWAKKIETIRFSTSEREHVYQVSVLIKNKVLEVLNFFYKSAFRLVGLDGIFMDLHQWNFSGRY